MDAVCEKALWIFCALIVLGACSGTSSRAQEFSQSAVCADDGLTYASPQEARRAGRYNFESGICEEMN